MKRWLIILVCVAPLWGLPAVVQGNGNLVFAGNATISLTGVSGSDEVVAVGYNGNTANTISIDNSCGGWTTLLSNNTSASRTFSVWLATAPTSTCSATITASVNNNNNMIVLAEISGAGASDATPVPFQSVFCTTACVSSSITPATTGDLLLFMGVDPSQALVYGTFSNGFSINAQGKPAGGGTWGVASFVDSGTSAISTTYQSGSAGGTSASAGSMVAIKASGGGGGSTPAGFKLKKLQKFDAAWIARHLINLSL